jgi:hypothetical protein
VAKTPPSARAERQTVIRTVGGSFEVDVENLRRARVGKRQRPCGGARSSPSARMRKLLANIRQARERVDGKTDGVPASRVETPGEPSEPVADRAVATGPRLEEIPRGDPTERK